MKRTIYIILAGILGLMLGVVFHAVVETLILRAGVSWFYWHPTYHVPFTIVTAFGGFAFGLWLGKWWSSTPRPLRLEEWRMVYIEKRHHGWFQK